ncbi:MAG: hypothetical protein DMD83_01675, partial [Candidatus Rokuibacteriota bacterium]
FNQAGNGSYDAAAEVTSDTAARPATQSIAVKKPAPASAPFNASFRVAAKASSGLPVAVTTTGVCSSDGSTTGGNVLITMTGAAGTCTVHYNQAGSANYLAATEVSSDTTAQPAAQSIKVTTSAPSSASYNASFTVAATASSGLPVAIATTGVCTGGGTGSAVVTMTSGSGTCAVTFNQAGDASYLAAPQKTQTTAAREAAQSIAVTTSAPPTAAFGASFPVAATSSSTPTPARCTSTRRGTRTSQRLRRTCRSRRRSSR